MPHSSLQLSIQFLNDFLRLFVIISVGDRFLVDLCFFGSVIVMYPRSTCTSVTFISAGSLGNLQPMMKLCVSRYWMSAFS